MDKFYRIKIDYFMVFNIPHGTMVEWNYDDYKKWLNNGCPINETVIGLDISYGQIKEIPKEIGKLINLQTFYCYNNQIKEIPKEIGNLINLKTLYCRHNEIKEIPKEIGNLVNLQQFDCSYNQIKEIPKEIGKLINLQTFYFYYNQIKEIPKEIGNLVNLQQFYCGSNQIKETPKEIGNLINLQEFYCYDNQIKEIPQTIINLRRLRYFDYSNNPIEYISPNVRRFLDSLANRGNVQNVYNDGQNVHNHKIQQTITTSIQNIISIKPIITNVLEQIIKDNILNDFSKQSIIEYCQDKTIHSILNITFEELLVSVWNRIIISQHTDEIKRILNNELQDSVCKCFTGRMSRLINCLNGFDDLVNIRINDSEQIANIIKIIKNELNNDYSIEKHKDLVRNRLIEMNYEQDIIDLWISFIE